jgi:hypothetical protein
MPTSEACHTATTHRTSEQLRALTITRKCFFARRKTRSKVYKRSDFVDTPFQQWTHSMAPPKNKQEARLQELVLNAKRRNIHVRTEKLLREAGYRAKSGSCRVNGQEVILIDRDARISDQIEFLAGELAEREEPSSNLPPKVLEN